MSTPNRDRAAAPGRAGAVCLALALALSACGDPSSDAAPTPLSSGVDTSTESSEAATSTSDTDAGETARPPESADEADEADEASGTEPETPAPPPDDVQQTGAGPDTAEQTDAARERDQDPRIAAVQDYAEQLARAATADDIDREAWLATMTEAGRAGREQIIGPDLGWTYPGPLPFTVTKVVETDHGPVVETCVLASGFALDPETGAPAPDVTLYPIEFHLAEREGSFLVDGVYQAGNRCDNVTVEAPAW